MVPVTVVGTVLKAVVLPSGLLKIDLTHAQIILSVITPTKLDIGFLITILLYLNLIMFL